MDPIKKVTTFFYTVINTGQNIHRIKISPMRVELVQAKLVKFPPDKNFQLYCIIFLSVHMYNYGNNILALFVYV